MDKADVVELLKVMIEKSKKEEQWFHVNFGFGDMANDEYHYRRGLEEALQILVDEEYACEKKERVMHGESYLHERSI